MRVLLLGFVSGVFGYLLCKPVVFSIRDAVIVGAAWAPFVFLLSLGGLALWHLKPRPKKQAVKRN